MAEMKDVYWLTGRAGELALDGTNRFWKELIRVGRWVNTQAGFALEVDGERLAAWKGRFGAMLDAGIRVPVPWGHSYDPRDNAGFVEQLELRDDALWGLLCIPDPQDAEKVGHTVAGVSVSINPNFVDGTGREWGEVIEHVALTNYPVVTDQANFIQAAVDGGSRRAIALELTTDAESVGLVELARQIGIEGDLDESGAAAAIRQRFDELTAELEALRAELVELRAPEDDGNVGEADDADTPDARSQELQARLCRLERERADKEIDEAMRQGKFTRPAAEALRQLAMAGVAARYELDAARPDIARLALEIIMNTPPGAAVDLAERARLHAIPNPSGSGMTDAKAAQLAKENRKLAGV
jgi:phage gp46-like protein